VPSLCWSVNQTAPFRLVPSKLSLIRYGSCDPVWESPARALNDAAGSTAALDPANTALTAAQAASNTIRLNTGLLSEMTIAQLRVQSRAHKTLTCGLSRAPRLISVVPKCAEMSLDDLA
jgi:hypothetical protein